MSAAGFHAGEVRIDGQLSEPFWKVTPRMPFAGLADGSPSRFDGYSQMIWDDEYLYAGFWGADPEVVASMAADSPSRGISGPIS